MVRVSLDAWLIELRREVALKSSAARETDLGLTFYSPACQPAPTRAKFSWTFFEEHFYAVGTHTNIELAFG